MSGTTTDPNTAELHRIGDAIFSLKNSLVGAIGHVAIPTAPVVAPPISPGGPTPPSTTLPNPPTLPVPGTLPVPVIIAGKQDEVLVGPGRDVKEIADALAFVKDGGTITADDGRYLTGFHCENPNIVIQSASGNPFKCYIDGRGGVGGGHRFPWGKAPCHFGAPFTMKGIGGRNCGSPGSTDIYSNEAFIYAELFTARGKAHVIRCSADNCANGFFAPGAGAGGENVDWLDEECIMGYLQPNGQNAYANRTGSHPAHDRYLNCATVEVSGAYSYGNVGHSIKSRSPNLFVHDCPLLVADGGRAIEATEGGVFKVNNVVLATRTDRTNLPPAGTYGNSNLLAYADEGAGQGSQGGNLDGVTMYISRLNSTIFVGAGTLAFTNSQIIWVGDQGALQFAGGGHVTGIESGSCPPGQGRTWALPTPPAWATP